MYVTFINRELLKHVGWGATQVLGRPWSNLKCSFLWHYLKALQLVFYVVIEVVGLSLTGFRRQLRLHLLLFICEGPFHMVFLSLPLVKGLDMEPFRDGHATLAD